jgi:hypothetical protein
MLWYIIVSETSESLCHYENNMRKYFNSSAVIFARFIILILLCVSVFVYRTWIMLLYFSMDFNYISFFVWLINFVIMIFYIYFGFKIIFVMITAIPFTGSINNETNIMFYLFIIESIGYSISLIFDESTIRLASIIQTITLLSGLFIVRFVFNNDQRII